MPALSTTELLSRVGLFARLTPEALDAVASQVRKIRYARGEVIIQQGGMSNILVVLLAGSATVLRRDDAANKEVHLATLEPGSIAGEMSILDGEPHSASVRADAPVDALVLTREDFVALLPSRATLAYEVMQGLVQRLRVANEKIEQLALTGLRSRVRSELLAMAVERGGERVILRRIDKPGLARRVGGSREAVSRVMREMTDAGELSIEESGATIVHIGSGQEESPPASEAGGRGE
jgi:CRP-like cAMP-binding protein